MNDYDADVAELLEDIDESDDLTETDEERTRFRPFRPKVPSGKGLFKGRPESRYVTQVQLSAAMTRVGGQIKANGDATKALSTRVNALGTDVTKVRKDVATIRKEASSGRMLSILPLLLTKPPVLKSFTTDAVPEANKKTNVTSAEFEAPDILLPMMLLLVGGGLGGGESKSGEDSMMLMLPLVLILSQQPKK
jgi:hypothetical protein